MSVEEPSLPASEESYTSNTLVWLCSCGRCVTLRAVELALLYQVGDAKVRTLYHLSIMGIGRSSGGSERGQCIHDAEAQTRTAFAMA